MEKKCVVCGQGSHRTDWATLDYPACDNHSKVEVAAAVAAAKKAATAVPMTPVAPKPAAPKA